MSKIYENLFLGSVNTSRDQAFFKQNSIKNVLIAAKNLQRAFVKVCVYYQLQISDNPTTIILKFWPESIKFLSEATGNTLVHCQGGKSRSASTVMAFVMFKENITAQEAILKVRKLHKFAYPNAGFLKQLEYWQEVIEQYRNKVPLNTKEDFELLDKLTSVKLNEVSQKIIKPCHEELSEASQKINFVEDGEDTTYNKKNKPLIKNKTKKDENQKTKLKGINDQIGQDADLNQFKEDANNQFEDRNENNQEIEKLVKNLDEKEFFQQPNDQQDKNNDGGEQDEEEEKWNGENEEDDEN